MRALVWNYQGFENTLTIHALKKMVKIKVPTIIFLMDRRLSFREAELLKADLGLMNGFSVDYDYSSDGRKGGSCLFWFDLWNVSLQSYSLNHINVTIGEVV